MFLLIKFSAPSVYRFPFSGHGTDFGVLTPRETDTCHPSAKTKTKTTSGQKEKTPTQTQTLSRQATNNLQSGRDSLDCPSRCGLPLSRRTGRVAGPPLASLLAIQRPVETRNAARTRRAGRRTGRRTHRQADAQADAHSRPWELRMHVSCRARAATGPRQISLPGQHFFKGN